MDFVLDPSLNFPDAPLQEDYIGFLRRLRFKHNKTPFFSKAITTGQVSLNEFGLKSCCLCPADKVVGFCECNCHPEDQRRSQRDAVISFKKRAFRKELPPSPISPPSIPTYPLLEGRGLPTNPPPISVPTFPPSPTSYTSVGASISLATLDETSSTYTKPLSYQNYRATSLPSQSNTTQDFGSDTPVSQDPLSKKRKRKSYVCGICNEVGHNARSCRQKCRICGLTGHHPSKCKMNA